MKSYCGRKVRIYGKNILGDIVPTLKCGHLLEIDVQDEHVMIEDEAGRIVKLSYKLVRLL